MSRPLNLIRSVFGEKTVGRLSPFLLLPDLLILYFGLLVGHKIRFGNWLLPHITEWSLAAFIILGVYVVALLSSGIYTMDPRDMHLDEFIDVGGRLVGAWVLSIAFTYVTNPANLPPRGMMASHGLVSLVGVLGLRAVLRRALEYASGPSTDGDDALLSRPNVQLSDLISRTPVPVDRPALRDFLSDRTVLVTGAGGSIGSELSAQLLDLNPFRLVLVDVSEHNLYQLERSLRSRSYDGDLEFCIADVRDETVTNGLMAREQPDVVLHTAAYKHVPLMERHPAEAFRNNTMATVHLLRLSEQHNVEQFTFVSTDKAVEPSSVLGATKQLAEWYVRTAPDTMQSTIVRFGNVFGSQGSVVPRFEEKLAAGDALPITHPDMERYFMTSGEACRLILQTLLFNTYPIHILKMGDPVRIQWLAEQLIERYYPHVDPESMIEFVGRRPGEKLSEQLTHDNETVHATTHPSILGLNAPIPYSRTELENHFRQLQALCDPAQVSREQLRQRLLKGTPTPTLSSSESAAQN
jgi:FlaA1/EpsC-like NDP-sugar epimerase